MRRKLVLLGSPFPLTPALSLEERENPRQSVGESGGGGMPESGAWLLPLPRGEGRGEGKWDARNASVPCPGRTGENSPTLKRLSLPTSSYACMGTTDRTHGSQANGLTYTSPGQRPGFPCRFVVLQASGLLHWGRITSEDLRQASVPRRHESRFQRSEWYSADEPRALPWAGMEDAVGVPDRPAVPSFSHLCTV
jgi:hypothetical protein